VSARIQTRFATTSWTLVLAARESPSTESRQALDKLCRTYWYPLYTFIRHQVHDADQARDLTQAYFAELLDKGYLEDYEPARGRFRVFLKASITHFLSKERDKARTWKRGGHAEVISLDIHDVEGRFCHEPVDRLTPEEIFERRWALTVLERVLDRLRREQHEDRGDGQFALLEPFLTGRNGDTSHRDVATQLHTSEGAVKTAVYRLRQRFGRLLREEIAETVANPDQVDDEVKHLLHVVTR
jgi:DNA-directed RNA polymerase specialized sigma24 family protein